MDKTVVAWVGANQVLSPRFHELFRKGAPTRTDKYKEIGNQKEQHRAFFTEQAQAIVVDKTIFDWQKYNFKEQFSIDEAYDIHTIFPEKTYYYVAFKDKKIRDEFNKALDTFKKNGTYKDVYKHYVEGRIKLQLEITNLITQISAPYIFDEKRDALEKILQAFIKGIPSLHTVDVYDDSTNSLFLQVVQNDFVHKEKQPAKSLKTVFTVGQEPL